MTDKEVRRLRRIELLEILIDQKKEIEELRTRLEEARRQIERDDALIQRLMSIETPRQAPASSAAESESRSFTSPETVMQTSPASAAGIPAFYEADTGVHARSDAFIPRTDVPEAGPGVPAADSQAYAEPEGTEPPAAARSAYDDEAEGDYIPMRVASASLARSAWLTAEEPAAAPDPIPRDEAAGVPSEDGESAAGVSAEILSGETDDPADAEAADSEVSADGAEPAMTNEELDEYLQRLINEDDA